MTESQRKKERRYDLSLILSICFLVFGLFLTNFSVSIELVVSAITPDMVSKFSKVLILVSLLFALPALISRFELKMLVLAFATALIYFIQNLFFPQHEEYFSQTFNSFLLTVFPAAICFLAVRDYGTLLKWLLKLSTGISAICLLGMLISGPNLFGGQYVMGFSNSLILPTNFLLAFIYRKETVMWEKIVYILMVASNCICIAIFGARGALVAILVFAFYFSLKSNPGSTKRFLICIFLLIIGLLFLLYYEQIILSLNELLNEMGFRSRTIKIILTDVAHDSGRNEIWEELMTDLRQNIFAIRGINADYTLLGVYAHNIVLELFYDLGPVLAVSFLIYILYCGYSTICSPLTDYSVVLNICMFSCFPNLLWSGSVWTSMYFWIWIMLFSHQRLQLSKSSLDQAPIRKENRFETEQTGLSATE